MALYLVRAGKHGERELGALQYNVVTVGWKEFDDLSHVKDRKELEQLYREKFPNASKMKAVNEVSQLWIFLREIQKGSLVALPLKSQSAIAIGRVEGDYQYKEIAEGIKHIRPVKWLKTIPRSEFDQDLLYSLGAFMTVCRIQRNDAENRIRKMLGMQAAPKQEDKASKTTTEIIETEEYARDIEENAKDEIVKYIGTKFVGHNLARLVEAILKAQGYVTYRSPEGPDGGVDILAGTGPLGFNEPQLCVQVKSSTSPVDVSVIRELQGVIHNFGAKQGLLVSWGGFNSKALQDSRKLFFSIRLLDQGELLDEIAKYYDKFDDELKAELPLKRIWALVKEE